MFASKVAQPLVSRRVRSTSSAAEHTAPARRSPITGAPARTPREDRGDPRGQNAARFARPKPVLWDFLSIPLFSPTRFNLQSPEVLAVSEPSESSEREADTLAERVMASH